MKDDDIEVPRGRPGTLLEVAKALGAVGDDAEHLRQTIAQLDGATGPAVWRGPAADAFRELLAEVGPELAHLTTAHHRAQEAVRGYANALETAQREVGAAKLEADRARSERETARREKEAASTEVKDQRAAVVQAEEWLREAATQRSAVADPTYQAYLDCYQADVGARATAAQNAQADAEQRHSRAEESEKRAEAIIKAKATLARQALQAKDAAARTAARELDDAGRPAVKSRSFFEKATDFVGDKLRGITASPAFEGWLNVISDVADIAFIVGPFLGPFAPFVLGAAALAKVGVLGATFVAYRYGHASKGQLAGRGLDTALSIVPGGKMAKWAGEAGRALRQGQKVERALEDSGRARSFFKGAGTKAKELFEVRGRKEALEESLKRLKNPKLAPVKLVSAIDKFKDDLSSVDDPQEQHEVGKEGVRGAAAGVKVALSYGLEAKGFEGASDVVDPMVDVGMMNLAR